MCAPDEDAADRQRGANVTFGDKSVRGYDVSDGLAWPEEAGSAPLAVLEYRRWTFSYMGGILRKGSRQVLEDGTHLTQADLYRVPTSMETAQLDYRFRAEYAKEEEGDGDGGGPNLHRVLWRLAAPTFIPAGFCQLLTVVCQLAIPLLVKEILVILETNPGEKVWRQGLAYVVAIFLASVLNAFGTHRQRHLALKSGIAIRAAVVSAAYRKALSLSPGGRAGLSTGEVTNLVAVDAQKLFEVMQDGHLVWSCPLSMCLVSILLVVIMGPTTLVGVAILFMFVPITSRITRKMCAVRKSRVRVGDERVEIINAMLKGIKVTKLNNYEGKYLRRINETREKELKFLRAELYIWALTLSITVVTPVLASAVTYATFVLVEEDNVLTASKTFTTLLLFSALRFPINYAGRLVGEAAQAYEAARRIAAFLHRESMPGPLDSGNNEGIEYESGDASSSILEVKNGNYRIGGTRAIGGTFATALEASQWKGQFSLTGLNFSVDRGEILAVVGPVGAGKSVLMGGLIGEVSCSPESVVSHRGRVAYASQVPFILNASLRENVLFGSPLDQERYDKVLDACCLRQDIFQLGVAGDLTEIGERGITLSGGQKQRVSLARAVYSLPALAILDDPLSALDAGTARRVFDQVLKSKDPDLLGSSAVVLVTHASYFLHRVDNIMLLVEGRSAFLGSWDELLSFENSDPAAKTAIDAIKSSVQEKEEAPARLESVTAVENQNHILGGVSHIEEEEDHQYSTRALMKKEEREHGLSTFKTWFIWFNYAGGFTFIAVMFLSLAIDRSAYVATEWWLARWTQASDGPVMVFGNEFPEQTNGFAAQYQYLKVYATILLISCFAACQRSLWAVRGGTRSARSLFKIMAERILLAPLSFFETTPLGRILNRFTYDIEVLDHRLTEHMSVFLIAMSWFVAGVCVMTFILPWIILALIPVTMLYWTLQMHYRKSGADLQRLDAVSRSPLQAMLAEGIDGAATIKVYKQEQKFLRRFHSSTSTNTAAQLNFVTSERWLGIRIELLGALILFTSILLAITFNDVFKIDVGLVAMLIIWSSNFTITLGFLVDNVSETEADITSVERIRAMSNLSQEKSMITDEEHRPPASWPSKGHLQFQQVCLRYRPGLPLALDGLSFSIEPGCRCGVVGRTGAGKSTLTTALFRLVEVELGCIKLDGIDLSTLGLSDVRGRANGMAIIPQDPVLMRGTLRECLDPFGSSTDSEVMDALASVRLAEGRGAQALDFPIEEGGSNFSVGQRQLLCLARAMLSQPKLLVLDEATASVDGETDAFIQRMLRNRFKGTTLLTVAHRLNTIMDYDTVLVMDKGKAVEFGSPQTLLANENGVFADLVNSTGFESAIALREMAGVATAGSKHEQSADR